MIITERMWIKLSTVTTFNSYIILIITVFISITKAEQSTEEKNAFNSSSCLDKPYRCPHPKINFFLYTKRTQKYGEQLNVLDPESLYNTHFNPQHPTKVVIHGFGGGRNNSPSPDIREAYFKLGSYNIIIVDYSNAVKEPCLSQMEWAPRFGAMCVAQMVKYISNHPRGVPPDYMHFIGYSVGAHIAGLVANFLTPEEGKIGRITGLDPTIFYYNTNNKTRDLDPSDAHFVDILHTNAGILGHWSTSGHADFYINGGTSQPGCQSLSIFQTLACDHTKVTPYFIESINSKAGFWAGPCPSLFSYLFGWCEPKLTDYVLMGEHVSWDARGVYYITTNEDPPFARGHPGKLRKARNGDGKSGLQGYQGVRRRRWQIEGNK